MPPGTGGRGSYGHSHRTQEELVLVTRGTVTFKVGDDVFEAGPGDAVRLAPAGAALDPQRLRTEEARARARARSGSTTPRPRSIKHEDFWPE